MCDMFSVRSEYRKNQEVGELKVHIRKKEMKRGEVLTKNNRNIRAVAIEYKNKSTQF